MAVGRLKEELEKAGDAESTGFAVNLYVIRDVIRRTEIPLDTVVPGEKEKCEC